MANDVDKVISALSANLSFFPPGRQAMAELSQEIGVSFNVIQEVSAQLAVGLLKFSSTAVAEAEAQAAASAAEAEAQAVAEELAEANSLVTELEAKASVPKTKTRTKPDTTANTAAKK